jgi:hypothetical protein
MTTDSPPVPTKVLQPHGGALNSGGTPGNRGGSGRPPSEVRRIARDAFAERLPILARIADGEVVLPLRDRCAACGYEHPNAEAEREATIKRAATPGEQVRALEALARVGMSGNVSIDDVRLRMIAQVRVTREWGADHGISRELIENVLERYHDCWRGA